MDYCNDCQCKTLYLYCSFFFFFNDTATTEIYTLSLHDALPISLERGNLFVVPLDDKRQWYRYHHLFAEVLSTHLMQERPEDRKSTRLNSSHANISYAVFCLKKKKILTYITVNLPISHTLVC